MLCVSLRSQLPPPSQKYNHRQIKDVNLVNHTNLDRLGRPPERSYTNRTFSGSIRAQAMVPQFRKREIRTK